jgi:cation transport ATPase
LQIYEKTFSKNTLNVSGYRKYDFSIRQPITTSRSRLAIACPKALELSAPLPVMMLPSTVTASPV